MIRDTRCTPYDLDYQGFGRVHARVRGWVKGAPVMGVEPECQTLREDPFRRVDPP